MKKNLLRLFQFNGAIPYIHSDRFVHSYRDLDGIASGHESLWISYMSKEAEERTRDIGLELYSSIEAYEKLKRDYVQVYQKIVELKDHIETKADVELFFKLCVEYGELYRLTEFFYTDLAFEQKDTNPTILKNFESFEQFKLDGRTKLNAIFFIPGSLFETVLRKAAVLLSIPAEELLWYSMKEVTEGIKVDGTILNQRKLAHIVYAENGVVKDIVGKEAHGIIMTLHGSTDKNVEIKGRVACKGKVTGRAKVIKVSLSNYDSLASIIDSMQQGDVLIAESTEPAIIQACQKASAIVTNQGGMMSHAAIVSRELNIPCIVGTGNATELINDGDMVEVDANSGIVRIL